VSLTIQSVLIEPELNLGMFDQMHKVLLRLYKSRFKLNYCSKASLIGKHGYYERLFATGQIVPYFQVL
jgi:hypothetical protein